VASIASLQSLDMGGARGSRAAKSVLAPGDNVPREVLKQQIGHEARVAAVAVRKVVQIKRPA
jgi:hypothetical protein